MKSFGALLLLASAALAARPLEHAMASSDMLVDLSSGLHKRQTPPAGDMPEIDLGYVKQRATEYGTAGGVSYYVFRNIRFAVSCCLYFVCLHFAAVVYVGFVLI